MNRVEGIKRGRKERRGVRIGSVCADEDTGVDVGNWVSFRVGEPFLERFLQFHVKNEIHGPRRMSFRDKHIIDS